MGAFVNDPGSVRPGRILYLHNGSSIGLQTLDSSSKMSLSLLGPRRNLPKGAFASLHP